MVVELETVIQLEQLMEQMALAAEAEAEAAMEVMVLLLFVMQERQL